MKKFLSLVLLMLFCGVGVLQGNRSKAMECRDVPVVQVADLGLSAGGTAIK